MSQDAIYERIKTYLLNKMSEQERATFEAEMLADEKLAQQVEKQKMERKMMEVLVEDDLLQDMRKWQEEDEVNSAPSKNETYKPWYFRPQILLGLILFVLLAAFLFWLLKPNNATRSPDEEDIKLEQPLEEIDVDNNLEEVKDSLTPEIEQQLPPKRKRPIDIAEDNNSNKDESKNINDLPKEDPKPLLNPIALANKNHESVDWDNDGLVRGNNLFFEAIDSIKNNNYKGGIEKLTLLIQSDSTELDFHYYLGLAYCDDDKYIEAIPHLKKIVQSPDGYLNMDRVQWRLALAYLQNGNVSASKELLDSIADDEYHKYHEKATILIQEIEALSGNN